MSITKELEIKNIKGIHARAAAAFVKLAETFSSNIEVERIGMVVSGLSIMGLMMLSASKGTTRKVIASGSDEEQAIQEITKLIDNKFGEE